MNARAELRSAFLIPIAAFGVSCFSTAALATDTFLSRSQLYNTLYIAAGDRIVATGDLRLECTTIATIDGMIVAQTGFSIDIISPLIDVVGSISGGEGAGAGGSPGLATVGAGGAGGAGGHGPLLCSDGAAGPAGAAGTTATPGVAGAAGAVGPPCP